MGAEPRAPDFRRAMDGLMAKRAAQFADPVEWRDLRALGAAIRARTLARLPEHLARLEKRCRENGIAVRWAETTGTSSSLTPSRVATSPARSGSSPMMAPEGSR